MRLNVNIKIFQHFINLVYNITYHNPELHPTISIVLDENFSKDTRYNLYKNAVAVHYFSIQRWCVPFFILSLVQIDLKIHIKEHRS